MSDKNVGHNDTQWTKAAAAAAHASQQQQRQQQQQAKHNPHSPLAAVYQLHAQHQQHHHLQQHQQQQQQQQRLFDPSALMPAHSSIFGASVGATLGNPAHPDGIAAYAGARFHPPPLPSQQQATIDATNLSQHIITHQPQQQHTQQTHHLQHQAPPSVPPHQPQPTHAPTTVLTASAAAATSPSVPVQSGFVPPPLLPAAAAVAAAATSVLTPNPFAVTQQLEHLTSHLNLQQQFELNKIMNAMSTHPSTSATTVGGSGVSVGIAASANSASSHQQTARQQATDVPMTTAVGSNISNSSSSSKDGSGVAGGAALSGVISSTIAENVLNAISATRNSSVSASVPAVHGRLAGMGVRMPDDDRLHHVQKLVESGISASAKEQIQQIVERISTLKPVEKLLLYLRLPGETPETDPLRHPQNPLGTRSEINHTINWVRTHLEHDPKVSIPKQDVYNDYIAYCERLDIKPLSTADFGKVMKQVFPGVRPRRLGTRGHSRYCYAAMRKTTKLDAPQLPLLDSAAANESASVSASSSLTMGGGGGVSGENLLENTAAAADTETWQIIGSWAENVLNAKVDSAKELAARIKSSAASDVSGGNMARAGSSTTHKKYTPREPKEKRLMVDMGPLKKRRKKRRKGSSSSESSCSQTQAQAQATASTSATSNTQAPDVKPNINVELVQIKQELIESPIMQHIQYMPATATHHPQVATVGDSLMQQQQQQQQQQMLPMNLVTEQRTVLARAPPAASAFDVVQPQSQQHQQEQQAQQPRQRQPLRTALMGATPSTTAVKNLTPKIIELGAAATAAVPSPSSVVSPEMSTAIKEEEFLDEYNPNIFCKKVRKAQQTKGFWANSPTAVSVSVAVSMPPSHIVVPTITTTAAAAAAAATATSPPSNEVTSATATLSAVATSVIATSGVSSSSSLIDAAATTSSDLMGPPTQTVGGSLAISPSNAAMLSAESSGSSGAAPSQPPTAASPKVLSRNMLQMRARRQQIAAALAAEAAANAGNSLADGDAGDLPSNLGLPRERVISICNMDKHELDDYFVDGEVEEEPEDQDTELLQYFQTRDAEEKLNTSDAIKSNQRHSTAITQQRQQQETLSVAPPEATAVAAARTGAPTTTATTSCNTPTTAIAMTSTLAVSAKNAAFSTKSPLVFGDNAPTDRQYSAAHTLNADSFATYAAVPQGSKGGFTVAAGGGKQAGSKTTQTITTTPMAVGSASASLTLMSQKHQKQQQQQQQQKHPQTHAQRRKANTNTNTTNNNKNTNANKRKITLSGTTVNAADVIAARKNCIFFPISPNSSNTSGADGGDNKQHNMNKNAPQYNKSKKVDSAAALNTTTTNTASGGKSTSSGNAATTFFLSPLQSVQRVRPKPAYALGKQLSLDHDSSDPMIGASRRRRSYANLVISGGGGGTCVGAGGSTLMPLTTSASAPPSPSVLQQQQQQQQYQQMYVTNCLSGNGASGGGGGGGGGGIGGLPQQSAAIGGTGHHSTAGAEAYNELNAADLLAAEQNSLDLDMFSAAAARAMDEYDDFRLDELATPLNSSAEMQRSQSVPLSQLQRIHSPAFNRSFQAAPYSACTSVAQTPVPHDYADSSTLFSENSSSQNSGGGGGGKHSATTQAVAAKQLDDEAALLATDTAAMLDNLDVAEMFTADFLRIKFPQNAQGTSVGATTTTTCSSAGSSSGYSSSACTAFSSSALISGSGGGGGGGGGGTSLFGSTGNTMSRSVPSTPLPHQQQQSPFASYFYGGGGGGGGRRRYDDEAHLSPSPLTGVGGGGGAMGCGGTFTTTIFKYHNHSGGGGGSGIGSSSGYGGGHNHNSYDISRSMPTTPTATPRFRYSPTEFAREFLSNGNTNTFDSLISGGANTNSLTDAGAPSEGLSDVLTGLTGNNDALIDDSCGLSADAFVNNTVVTDADSMMAEANELLGSL